MNLPDLSLMGELGTLSMLAREDIVRARAEHKAICHSGDNCPVDELAAAILKVAEIYANMLTEVAARRVHIESDRAALIDEAVNRAETFANGGRQS